MIKPTSVLFSLLSMVMVGCASKPAVKTSFERNYKYDYERDNNPTQFRYQPVIGTKQPDTKTMIDMGQWAKIWIKNYKNQNKTFVASHSIVTMIREPGFIAGEEIPSRRRQTVSDSYGGRTFTFRSSDLMYDNSSMGSDGLSDEQIKEYVNNYESSKKTERLTPQKREEVAKYDREILKYLEEKRLEEEEEKKAREEAEKVREEAKSAALKEHIEEKRPSDCPNYMTDEECIKGAIK